MNKFQIMWVSLLIVLSGCGGKSEDIAGHQAPGASNPEEKDVVYRSKNGIAYRSEVSARPTMQPDPKRRGHD